MRLVSFLSLLYLIPFTLLAQSPLQEGYELISTNQPFAARDYFKKAIKSEAGADAALALSFIEAYLNNRAGAIDYFTTFFELEQDETKRNAYLDAMWSASDSELNAGQLKMVAALQSSEYTRLRPLANYSLAGHYKLTNQLDKARATYAKLGMTEKWQILGHFENISESGFDQDFGALAHPEPSAVFTNKLGAEVTWFPIQHLALSRWLNFNSHLVTRNSILYAQTFCQSPEDRLVTMRLGTSGSVKVWVNDQLVFSEARERDNHLDTYVFTAPLLAGNNRILVQNGATEKTRANFMLRITDPKGNVHSDLQYSDVFAPYSKGKAWTPSVKENATEAYFQQLIAGGNANIIDYSTFAQFYLLNGFYEEARNVITLNLEKHPESISQIGELSVVFRLLDDETRASMLEQYIEENAPESMTAFPDRFSEAESTSNWTEFEQLLTRYKELYGESQFTLLKDISLAGNRKEVEGMINLINEGVKKFPDDPDLLIGKSKIASQIRKDPKAAIELLEKYAKKHYRSGIQEELISLYYNAGQLDEVEALIKQLIAIEPAGINYYSRLSKLYQQKGDFKNAQAMLRQAMELAPYSNSFYQSSGSLYADNKEEKKAQKAYQKAIALNPYDYDSRDALRRLTNGQPTAFSVLPETDYYENYNKALGAESYPDDNSVILNYDVDQVIYEGGASEIRTSVLIKILSPEGIEAWKEYSIPLYGDQKGVVEAVEVLSPDGSRHEASRNGTDIVFDGLKEGGAIFLTYRIKDFKYGRLNGKFWNDHPLNLSYPVVHSAYRLLVPEGKKFQAKITGPELDNVVAKKEPLDGQTLYTWESTNQPAIEPESTMPAFDDVLTQVRISNIDEWNFIAEWYSELTYAKVRADKYVAEQVNALFADKENLSPREEVTLIYDFIVNNIRYISVPFLQSNHIPQTASKTLATGQGDCKDVSTLFVAMCDQRGIPANLVLISTRDQARSTLALPSTGFNHCIGKVTLDQEDYFVELTDENLPFGTGDWSVNNAFGIVIPRKGESFSGEVGLINPPSRGVNSIRREGNIRFEGDDLLMEYQTYRKNAVVSNTRHAFEQKSPEKRKQEMLESLSGRYPRISLTELEFDDNLQTLSPELSYRYSYRAEDVSTSIAGMQIFEIKLSDVMGSPDWVTTKTRQLPVDLWQLFSAEDYEQTVQVTPPEGKKIVELPDDVTLENDYVAYALTFTQEGDLINLSRKFRLKQDIVSPSAYEALREDVLTILEADKITLAFR